MHRSLILEVGPGRRAAEGIWSRRQINKDTGEIWPWTLRRRRTHIRGKEGKTGSRIDKS